MKDRLQLDEEQISCLASPARFAVYNSLRMLGQGTVAQIAALNGKSAKGLYYHLKALAAVGLVETVEKRKVAKTEETVYRVAAQRLEIGDFSAGRDWATFYKAVLRMAERELEETGKLITDAERLKRGVNMFRTNVRLRPQDAKRFESMLIAAVRFAEEASHYDSGERMAVTILSVPLATTDG